MTAGRSPSLGCALHLPVVVRVLLSLGGSSGLPVLLPLPPFTLLRNANYFSSYVSGDEGGCVYTSTRELGECPVVRPPESTSGVGRPDTRDSADVSSPAPVRRRVWTSGYVPEGRERRGQGRPPTSVLGRESFDRSGLDPGDLSNYQKSNPKKVKVVITCVYVCVSVSVRKLIKIL